MLVLAIQGLLAHFQGLFANFYSPPFLCFQNPDGLVHLSDQGLVEAGNYMELIILPWLLAVLLAPCTSLLWSAIQWLTLLMVLASSSYLSLSSLALVTLLLPFFFMAWIRASKCLALPDTMHLEDSPR